MRMDLLPIRRRRSLFPKRPRLMRFALAVTITGLALALTFLLSQFAETRLAVFTLAVMVSAWYGGWKTGLLATALSLLAGIVFFYPRGPAAAGIHRQEFLELAVFLLLAVLVCWFNAALRSAQEALGYSESKFRSLVQNAPYGICRCSAEGVILEVNPALLAMLAYSSSSELIGENLISDIASEPQDAETLLAAARENEKPGGIEMEWKQRDGKPIIVRVAGRCVREGDRVASYELVAEDISERRALESQFRQAQKMEAVGRLAGGIAHDFNNLLMVISGYSQLLLDEVRTESPMRNATEEIQKAADRATSLTRQLLAFSRKQLLSPRVIDLNALVLDNLKMLPRLIGEDIEVVNISGHELGHIKADPGQLEQVLLNLVVNARDAMPHGGKLTIETANISFDETYTRSHPSMQPGEYVMLAISDNGSGMDLDTQSHIFEPFFTTKGPKGSGLGLSTVYGIVKQSGGYVWVYSEVGRGSTFKIYLPRISKTEVPEVEKRSTKLSGGKETILLVEDEANLRRLVRGFLQRQGYRVIEAEDGQGALEAASEHVGPIHLLLTDVVMPDMNGRELARKLSVLHPRTRVVYMSGYTENAIHHNGALEAGVVFLQKPFTEEALTQKVREVLERKMSEEVLVAGREGLSGPQMGLWGEDVGLRAPRISAHVPLRYRIAGEQAWRETTTQNISRSGVLFASDQSLEPKIELEISLKLPPELEGIGGAEVWCRGEVVRNVVPRSSDVPAALAAKFLEYRFVSRTPIAQA
jgi:PAS domain S-box-containing protein